MQERPSLMLSLGLNLALVAALLYQVSVLPKPDQFRQRGVAVTNNVTELEVEVIRPPAAEPPPTFKWSDVESPDYRVYIANLKKIGCPPATIQDIVLADARDEFAHKRTALMAPMHARFWELMANAPGKDPLESKELDRLEEQKEILLNQLVAAIGPVEEPAGKAKSEAKLNFLVPEKRQAVSLVEGKYRSIRTELFAQLRQSPAQRDEKMEVIRNLVPQQEADIQQLLTPTEWEEYQLRSSRNARWATGLFGFEPSLEEFHAVTRLKDAIKTPTPAPGTEPEAREKAAAAGIAYQAELTERLKQYFGEKRYADYERAANPGFEIMYKVADRYQLPLETAISAYQVRKAAEDQYRIVMQQETLTDDERVEAVLTVHAATVKALQKTFGNEVYQTYVKHDGGWLNRMLQP